MKKIILLLVIAISITACEELEQVPSNIANSDSLTDFEGVLNAAYFYQLGSVTPMAVMGDFRADNALMIEEPFPSFDRFNSDLLVMEDQFFEPFYIALYRSILSANNVIENSANTTDVGEAKFLRALSYFKLVRVFGDITVNLSSGDLSLDLTRQPAADVYNNVIIPDLQDAISALDNSGLSNGRATQIAAQGLLGKVYIQIGNFSSAESHLAAVINGAAAAGVSLQPNFANIFGDANDLNPEILFATQVSSSIPDEYGFTEFTGWFIGNDSKSFEPLDLDLVAAFDAAGDVTRKSLTVDEVGVRGIKYLSENPDQDWIELRLADVILLYAETLNENNNADGSQSASILSLLDGIRNRAGLTSLSGTANTQIEVRQAIANERRLELAFEGQRWFDLVRTDTVDAEMGETVNPNYYVFPIPISEILASNGVITQNPGY
ncbi:RagB/SusD family nutrient uptake outer membrane protein [Aquimarina litoralis]|uniref:RagB/SusD family nutrient uptake outer membrane protein n=1 Tax=Aquimarina litoralis TaxID=584605 RepID=UPI001C56720D|nr:RagB/SusD family nutrient uptake outer membrane protein [Aquimarina litoralis]MBW1295114.1 RagB/SusD family nutrient uptake outer membrane protein [Aquimarina litoralis]